MKLIRYLAAWFGALCFMAATSVFAAAALFEYDATDKQMSSAFILLIIGIAILASISLDDKTK